MRSVTFQIEKLVEKKYSGKQVEKAGIALQDLNNLIIDNDKFESVMDVLSYWRSSHEESLDLALDKLEDVVSKKDKSAIYAKRLKRYISIVQKLMRFKDMSLKNMQDIGGCRAVVANEKKLRQSVRGLKKLSYFKFENRKHKYKDYIETPKDDGYRGYHLIGKFPDKDKNFKSIEVQLRTKIQHYWATTLEIVDLFTDQALKSNQGDQLWKDFFIQISKQFAIMEKVHLFEFMNKNSQLGHYIFQLKKQDGAAKSLSEVKKTCSKLKVRKKLIAFSSSLRGIDKRLDSENISAGYVLLKIDTEEKMVVSTIFDDKDGKEAESAYTQAEKEFATTDAMVVALVSSGAVGGIKKAYPNYFADSSEFVALLSIIDRAKI